MLDPEVRSVLDTSALAHLATVLPDGSPHSVPLWVGVEGDKIAFMTRPWSRKVQNLRQDPRVALSLASPDDPYTPVVIRGRVVEWLEGEPAWEVVDRIAAKYIGQPFSREEERVVGVIEPSVQRIGIG
jgi:PPOX class probable F420-dependent enzyme